MFVRYSVDEYPGGYLVRADSSKSGLDYGTSAVGVIVTSKNDAFNLLVARLTADVEAFVSDKPKAAAFTESPT